MAFGVRDVRRRVARYVHDRVQSWRTGSMRSQFFVLAVLLGGVAFSFGISLWEYAFMPLAAYFVWLLLGMMLLRFWPLVVLAACASTAAVVAVRIDIQPLGTSRAAALVALALAVSLILYQSSRQRSGLPGPLSEAMLADLRDRLQAAGKVPPLPHGWRSDSAMLASQGAGFAGDFLVADLDREERHLEMVLVDVCGKGVAAGAQALQFAGALGGLIGALPQPAMFGAANDFLLRQHADESFSTAVHVRVDLLSGAYAITSAGHPPALRWDTAVDGWLVDNARGTALGILPDPELHSSEGVLAPGEALLFYTDGVVESRSADLDVGIDWLRATARDAIRRGYDGAADRIVRQVDRGDDDRAVLILSRGAVPAPRPTAPQDRSTAP